MFKLKNRLFSVITYFLIGAIISEITIVLYIIFKELYDVKIPTNWHSYCVAVIITLYIIITIYLMSIVNLKSKISKVLKSKRWDIYIFFLVGCTCSVWFKGFGIHNVDFSFITKTEVCHFIFIAILLILIGIALNSNRRKDDNNNKLESKFISDDSIKFFEDDKLNIKKYVIEFAENVYDNKSSNSLIFGVDSPWGTGKTSFVKLCERHLINKYKDDLIIYTFNPTIYERQNDIFDKFINGVTTEIKEHIFCPELRPIILEYAKALKASVAMSGLFQLNLSMNSNNSLDELLGMIEDIIVKSGKKILIVIDDLDRLDKSIINNTFTIIKKAFSIKNITYILCYDTENLNHIFSNGEYKNAIEFFEKYVNVKYTLFNSSKELFKKFVFGEDSIFKLEGSDGKEGTIVSGIIEIFESESYKEYIPYLGDIRKIKRLINTIKVLGLYGFDLREYDFDTLDLLSLILIYLNYPNLFRKIYNEETEDSRGFFSLVQKYDKGYPSDKGGTREDEEYKNSTFYIDYLDKLSDEKKFLVKQIFSEEKVKGDGEKEMSIRACYNGNYFMSGSRNLERHLKLITANNFPEIRDQYNHYQKAAKEIFDGKPINDVLWQGKFDVSNGEKKHRELIRILLRIYKYELSKQKEKKNEIIEYLLKNISKYTYIESGNNKFGYRYSFLIYLAEIIDISNYRFVDTDEKKWISDIQTIIFGDAQQSIKGVLNELAYNKPDILALYDLISFSHICSSQDTGFMSLILALHERLKSEDKSFTNLHMFCDYIRSYFEDKFINEKRDIFSEIDNLKLVELGGFWNNELAKEKTIEKDINRVKMIMKIYMTYQLLHLFMENEKGNDEFKKKVQKYMFDVCFCADKYESFLDYILLNFEHKHSSNWEFDIEKTKNRLGEKCLIEYWTNNKDAIMSKNYTHKRKEVFTSNYICTYEDDLPVVYEQLERLISN